MSVYAHVHICHRTSPNDLHTTQLQSLQSSKKSLLGKRAEIKYRAVRSLREGERKWRREGEAKGEGFCQDFINMYIEWKLSASIQTEENFPEPAGGRRWERTELAAAEFTGRPAKQQQSSTGRRLEKSREDKTRKCESILTIKIRHPLTKLCKINFKYQFLNCPNGCSSGFSGFFWPP